MFVHLHVHSPYSFIDGASTVDELVARVADLGMPALAITDHNNVTAVVRLLKAAKRAGIKPIIGAEVTVEGGYHLTLLCRGPEGYRNLCALLTSAHLENPRNKPEASFESLYRYKDGLIAMTGCRRGQVPSLILRKRFGEAKDALRRLKAVFGPESLAIEMSESLLPGSNALNRYLYELAGAEGLRAVATNNVHYARKEDFFVHDILTCIRTLTKLDDVHPERRLNAENYLKSEEEMALVFKEYPGALRATVEIAAQCEMPLDLGTPNFPSFPVPEGYPSPAAFLRRLVFEGAERRYGRITPAIEERLNYELYVIEELGYEDYFLVVWDLVRFAREQGVRHAGRGSAADSAVAYCLNVTDVDPIAQNLLFERFLSLERGEKPDIDVDFDARRRDEVAAYVRKKYGEDHVAAVATYNTFQARSAVRDVGKAMGYSPDEIDLIAKRIPYYLPAAKLTERFDLVPELKGLLTPKKLKTLLEAAERLAGLPRFLATHLGGLVISRYPITHLSPVQNSAKGVTIVQFDKDDVEDLGLVKIDLLSLRTLGAVEDSLGYMKEAGKELDYDRIPLDDERTYRRLRASDTVGVFQLESSAQRALQARLGAENIEDIVASVALIRPGPIKGNMVEPYVRRRHGLEPVTYLDPRLEPILKKTYGVVLFQEQVIEIASTIAGFTPGEADRLRRVMTHSRSGEEMEKLGRLFVEKAVRSGVDEVTAEAIFQCIRGYASYGFCEAHARAFGTTAYKTAYLIEHYPAEFFGAILNNEPMGYYPVSTVCVEARRHGVKITGPSANRSGKDVRVEGDEIILPFKMIGGLGAKTIEKIEGERKKGPFRSFSDFVSRVRPHVDELRAMVLSGVFDEFGVSRKRLIWSIPAISRENASAAVSSSASPGSPLAPVLVEAPAGNGPDVGGDFTLAEKIAYEYQVLGFSVSGHPVALWREELSKKGFVGSRDLSSIRPGEFVKVGGIPIRPHRPPTKSGRVVVFLSLEDEDGLIDITCFENVYQKYGKLLFPGEILPLGIWGQVQKRGNAYSVTARTVFPLTYALSGKSGR
ncbi:MAG TPA: DNA polymerase III subunit alpha [Firmicutes bacterium]|nr:DNA polymerase III subunit alpha [Candidatus Fermentithermobacillaceae bacterium]